jgi:hypothetical protein
MENVFDISNLKRAEAIERIGGELPRRPYSIRVIGSEDADGSSELLEHRPRDGSQPLTYLVENLDDCYEIIRNAESMGLRNLEPYRVTAERSLRLNTRVRFVRNINGKWVDNDLNGGNYLALMEREPSV